MRVVFLLLLLANAALYFWQYSERSYRDIASTVALPAAKGNIRLLSELEGERGNQGGLPELLLDGVELDGGSPSPAADTRSLAGEPQSAIEEVALVEAEAAEVCWRLGPFAKVTPDIALPEGGALRWMREDYQRGADFWVYLGPFGKVDEAAGISRELRKKLIDSYIIRRGELENAVSLGVFSDSERAQSHAERMRGRGYAAKVREIIKRGQRLWLVLKAVEGSREYDLGMELLRSSEGAATTLEKKNCNLIASYRDFD